MTNENICEISCDRVCLLARSINAHGNCANCNQPIIRTWQTCAQLWLDAENGSRRQKEIEIERTVCYWKRWPDQLFARPKDANIEHVTLYSFQITSRLQPITNVHMCVCLCGLCTCITTERAIRKKKFHLILKCHQNVEFKQHIHAHSHTYTEWMRLRALDTYSMTNIE